MKEIFLIQKDNECYYIDKPRFECDHYFGGLSIGNSNCSREFNYKELKGGKTYLSDEELKQLGQLIDKINELGYGIKKGDEKYQEGLKLIDQVNVILDKLQTPKAQELFNKIIEKEKEYCMGEYGLTKDEVNEVFENYPGTYRDRQIINQVFDNHYEYGKYIFSEFYDQGTNDIDLEAYVNFKELGEDNVNGEWSVNVNDKVITYQL